MRDPKLHGFVNWVKPMLTLLASIGVLGIITFVCALIGVAARRAREAYLIVEVVNCYS
jgi:hypothetical protein